VFSLCLVSLLAWSFLTIVPFRPWSTREFFSPKSEIQDIDLQDITVLIPARNEEKHIEETLRCLSQQGYGHKIILVDDESIDGTSDKAIKLGIKNLQLVSGRSPPNGWSGKVWALHQGFKEVSTPLVLLVDADIKIEPRVLPSLLRKMREDDYDFVSIMALLRTNTSWEKLLIPAFIYFFKILYPFALANNPRSRVAAAAGGLILTRTQCLREVGGFERIKDEIIDDCALARAIKDKNMKTWIGLSHAVTTTRSYESLSNIWHMVARTAYTQLRYSLLLLILASLSMVLAFVVPIIGLFSGLSTFFIALTTLALMAFTYKPTISLYNLPTRWALSLPLGALFFIMMTWSSALRYWKGERSQWKDRVYSKQISTRVKE
tara:strand:+ start:1357 stop:2487 length:1131 start_codon:yes stop_codon:yes gene_type:complete